MTFFASRSAVILRSFSVKLPFVYSVPACIVAWPYFISDTRLYLPVLNFKTFLSEHFSSWSRALWISVFFPKYQSLLPSLLSLCSIFLLTSLIKTLNTIFPDIDPWGIPLLTNHQLGFFLTITAFNPEESETSHFYLWLTHEVMKKISRNMSY